MIDTKLLMRLREAFSCWARAFAVLAALAAAAAVAEEATSPQGGGENVALGAKYTLWPRPSYSHCTDPGDATQLTDGQSTGDYFWTQKGTVGWQHVQYATVTVDLGRVEPISGVALTTAAGVAGVTWPLAIHVLVSDDGKTYRDAGDLVALDHRRNGPWPEGYAIRRLVTDELKTRGRFVQFVMIPLPGGPYTFVDEVQVFRGPEGLLENEPPGEVVENVQQFYQRGRVRRAVAHRFQADAEAIGQAITKAELADESVRNRLLDRLGAVRRRFDPEAVPLDASFRAVLPMGDAHARLFEVQAELWRSLGWPAFSATIPPTWDPVDPFELPRASRANMEVHTMCGEYRATALNLTSTAERPIEVRVSFDGLPGQPAPDFVTVHEVQWTDTSQGVPVAAALPEARREGGAWTVTVLPGLVRQVWLTFHVTDLSAGEYRGRVVLESEGVETLRPRIRLQVWPFEFPKRTTLWLGGWSYTNDRGSYGVTPQNRTAFLKHLQDHFVNAPWATSGVMMRFEFADDDPAKVRLDTQSFDDWIALWPNAGRYMVFLSVPGTCAGARIGTPEFERRVGAWISAWVAHLKKKDISPGQLGLLIRDEPHEGSDVEPIVAWARAIKAAEPDVLIWEDPTYRDPTKAPLELFEACDVLCPNRPMWLERAELFEPFYLDQKRKGKELQSYSCSGPARLLDPYSYYRLQAWHCWHFGGTGSFFWAFGDNSGSSSWNEYFAKAGPYTPLFIDDETITPGKQMEAIRESVEDYEYFVMLREAVERAKSSGRSGPEIAQAESLLRTAAQEVLTAPDVNQLRWHEPKDRTRADAVRVEILQVLASLKQ